MVESRERGEALVLPAGGGWHGVKPRLRGLHSLAQTFFCAIIERHGPIPPCTVCSFRVPTIEKAAHTQHNLLYLLMSSKLTQRALFPLENFKIPFHLYSAKKGR